MTVRLHKQFRTTPDTLTDDWRDQAECHITQRGEDVWFSDLHYDRILAATICEDCQVKEICLQGAQQRGEPTGVWGGYDFNPNHKYKTPAYCAEGHKMIDDMYVYKDGREVRCGICARRREYERAERKRAQRKKDNVKRNPRERAIRATKKAAIEGAAA